MATAMQLIVGIRSRFSTRSPAGCPLSFVGREVLRQNETDDRLISVGIDLMPTISDIVGVPMPPGPYYGKSVLPFVLDANSPAPTHEYVVTEAEVS